MLSEEEENIVRAGAAAERLISYPEWAEFEKSLRSLHSSWTMQALNKGDTDYAKGVAAGVAAVLISPQDTIARRKELLDRERALRAEAGDEEVNEKEEGTAP